MTDEQPANVTEINNEPVTYEPNDETPLFTKKTETQLMKSMYSTMMQKMLQPDPLTEALNSSMKEMAVDAIKSKFLGGAATAKTGWLSEFMNSQLGAQVGSNIKPTELLESLARILGKDTAQSLAKAAAESLNKQNQQPQQTDQANEFLNLDVKNPADVKKYAEVMHLREDVAATFLIAHQQQIVELQKTQPNYQQQPQQDQPQQPQQSKNEIEMMEKMQMMEQYIEQLEKEKMDKQNATVNDDGNKWSDDEAPMPVFNTKSHDVNLFNSAVKVDIDELSKNPDPDPFFKETPKKESVLIEEKDQAGVSSFRMSDDEPRKVEVTHRPVKPIETKKENVVAMKKMEEEVDDIETEEKVTEEPKEEKPPTEEPKESEEPEKESVKEEPKVEPKRLVRKKEDKKL